MRDNKHTRIAIITPESNDREAESDIIELREIDARPIIKVEDGEKRLFNEYSALLDIVLDKHL